MTFSGLADRSAPARGELRELAWLAAPVVLSQLSATLMGIVDGAIVGRLGATELAAVGFASIWIWTIFSFVIGTASAAQTFVSQAHGAGRPSECGAWAWHALWCLGPMGVLAALAAYLTAPSVIAWVGLSAELQRTTIEYMNPRLVGVAGSTLAYAWIAFFRGIGDTRTPLVAVLVANLANGLLAYCLVFGAAGLPRLGVEGAGIATASCEWLQGLVLLVAAGRGAVAREFATQLTAPARSAIRRLLRTGLPVGGQWVLDNLAYAVFLTAVARMSDAAMAASQALGLLLSLSFMQAYGIAVACATLVGRYIGAGDPEASQRSFESGIKLALWIASAVALLFFAAPELCIRIFSDDPAVIALGVPLVRLGALYELVDAVAIVASGALRGAGDTRWCFAVQAVLAWLLYLPAAWFFGAFLGFGLTGAWAGGLVYIGVMGFAFHHRFRSGAWREVVI
jgi:MATE family multidrug resistance protein